MSPAGERTCLGKQQVAVFLTKIDEKSVLISIDKNTGQTARIPAVAQGALRRVAWQRSTERLRGRKLGYTKSGLEKSTA